MQGFFWESTPEEMALALINMKYKIKKGMIDSHFHTMEMARKDVDVPEVLGNLLEGGVSYLLDAGVHLNGFESRLAYREFHPGLYLAAGIHPNVPSGEWPEAYDSILLKQGKNLYVKGIGETGLDYFREGSNKKDQFTLLDLHYAVSQKTAKPLIFHCRAAEKDLTDWIKSHDFPDGAILHCFSGNRDLGETALDKGFMISFAGNSTFKNAPEIREALHWIPAANLLIETDSPYLSPHPLRGKTNHPGHIGYIYEMISEQTGLELEDLIQTVQSNFKKTFKI
ncbi:MAG: hypothetical protein B6241_05540 [Spirochaetaceae bacterium 4572_59]|nr:MAG: hypothetical protein B6241_05540 [Spirochaetaceae bacterium 4572_59]